MRPAGIVLIINNQLKAVSDLDHIKLNDLLRGNGHENLILNAKDLSNLRELIKVLEPFAEATEIVQSDKTVTISCVMPIILSLNRHLQSCLTVTVTLTAFVKCLLNSLRDRFASLFAQLGLNFPSNSTTSLPFSSNIFLMTPALDPAYAFNWLEDLPGSDEDKEALRFKIHGMYSASLSTSRQIISALKRIEFSKFVTYCID